MLHNELPIYINPVKLCKGAPKEGSYLSGDIFLCKLKNLSGELKTDKSTAVKVALQFSIDSGGYCCIQGEISAELPLICQRCLQPMIYHLKSPILVSPVVSDTEAKKLPERYEPLLMHNGEVTLEEWIAEELHLALPLVPCHDSDCVS